MAQGEFTKEEAVATREALSEMFAAIPSGKRMGFLGHLNDAGLFVEAAARAIDEHEAVLTWAREAHSFLFTYFDVMPQRLRSVPPEVTKR